MNVLCISKSILAFTLGSSKAGLLEQHVFLIDNFCIEGKLILKSLDGRWLLFSNSDHFSRSQACAGETRRCMIFAKPRRKCKGHSRYGGGGGLTWSKMRTIKFARSPQNPDDLNCNMAPRCPADKGWGAGKKFLGLYLSHILTQ